MYIIPEFNNNHDNANNVKIESYNGKIKSLKDALLILEGTRIGILPKVKRRLNGLEREYITCGKIFAWNETECGMKRWTDGKNWSASKANGPFLIYKELDNDKLTIKEDGLIKQSFSLTTKQGEKFHLISYYKNNKKGNDPNIHDLNNRLPSNDPTLKNLKLNDNVYQEYLLYYDQYLNNNDPQSSTHGQNYRHQSFQSNYSLQAQQLGQQPSPYQPPPQAMSSVPIQPLPQIQPLQQISNIQSLQQISMPPNQSINGYQSNQPSYSNNSSIPNSSVLPITNSVSPSSSNNSGMATSNGYYPVYYRNPDSPTSPPIQQQYTQMPLHQPHQVQSIQQVPMQLQQVQVPVSVGPLQNNNDYRYSLQPAYSYFPYPTSSNTSPRLLPQSMPYQPTFGLSPTNNQCSPTPSEIFPQHSVYKPDSLTSVSSISSTSNITNNNSTGLYSINNNNALSISPNNRNDDNLTLKILDRGFSNKC